ncbi:hypothetical protein [uncultured Lamprocystis sp.]|jgi:hypothetical protein|uniref:hypothetical protein n=1 Tax=uncultured Lamprocystis sp. TaxID=543132 RepID=UPI0025F3266A|nr:hypothetical protein [uncultured Lamprocystis sp.]
MSKIANYLDFKNRLSALSLKAQRQLAAKFISDVLDLAEDPRLRHAVEVAAKSDATAEELAATYHTVHAIYVETNPQSDLLEMDFARQAAHFVTAACLVSLSPAGKDDAPAHLAQKVAMYCRMARTCSSMRHDDDAPDFAALGSVVERLVEGQYRQVENFEAA